MGYINTTFAHGNGPFSRCTEWAIAVNDVREEKGLLERLPVVVPLVYPGKQQRITREEVEENVSGDFFEKHPDEIWLDRGQGELLEDLMFKGNDYGENLRVLAKDYWGVEDEMHKHLDGKRKLENFVSGEVEEFDLRDCELQLGLNNRMQTILPNQFYTAGGAGPFDEVLVRAIKEHGITLDKEAMRKVLPVAERMIQGQKIIFSNEPGVFSYDDSRVSRSNEISTPPFVHTPQPDNTELPEEGVYFLATGIDGVRESGIYSMLDDWGMKVYAPGFSIKGLPDGVKDKAIALNPSQINNPKIVAVYARAGWSSVWLSHLAEKGFITPPYQQNDDPEMLFNERGIERLSLGVVMRGDARESLERAVGLSKSVEEYNAGLIEKYGTLEGIRYAAEVVVGSMGE